MTRLADRALKLAEAGFRVFPAYGIMNGKCECGDPNCDSIGKHPAIKGWKEKATSDKDQIMRWWSRNGNRNPAIATGKGLVVLDVDGETGKESLRKLEEEYGALPPTQCILTGRGNIIISIQIFLYQTAPANWARNWTFAQRADW